MTDSRHGRLIVLCGPAGVGKGTVLGRVREQHPQIWLSVSATTRKPRPGEVDGVNYFFITEQEFLAKEDAGEFLETADVFGLAHYGTPVKPVVEHLEQNIPVILEIDIQGARSVKQRAGELGLDVMTVFICTAVIRGIGASSCRAWYRNPGTAGETFGNRENRACR